jgi:outer membrane receptor protein involved in Fe transport
MNFKALLLAGSAAATFAASPVAAQNTTPAVDPNAPKPAAPAADQTAADDTATAPAAPGEQIVVTGTRIQGGTFVAPTPVTSLSAEALTTAAPSTLAEGLKQLPSIVPGGGQTAGGGTANGGQNFLNLRGLGNTRTLTLLDGRRFTPSNPTNLVDTNLLPQGLVSRVDVVTGGASAAYGSDAVGGVINFILDTHFEGLKLDLQLGAAQHGGNEEQKAQLSYGVSLADDRLHIIAAAEYFNSQGLAGDEREFRRTAANQLQNPAGTPKLVRGTDLRTPYTVGGLVVIGAGGTTANNNLIRGIQFLPGGGTAPYNYGTIASDIGITSGSQNGGDGFRVSTGQEIVRPLNRKTLFGHAEFDISDNLHLFVEGSYGKTLAEFQSSPTTHTLTIQRTNPYLAQAAPALVAQMTQLGVTRFTLNRLTLERGLTVQDNYNETVRGVVGLRGNLFGNWSWDVSAQYGRNDNHNPMHNNLITANIARAANAVLSGGQIVCADTISTDPAVRAAAVGCVPFNPFGYGAPSQASLDYVFGTSVFDTRTTQKAADVNLSGDLFKLPAGPLSVAVGAEWREIEATTTADPLSNAGGYRLVNQQDFYGKYSVKEVYGELQIPVLKDSPVGSLDVNVAGRYTDYSTSGGVTTWKAGASWEVVDGVRFRATRSRDIRAPNLQELFATGRQNNITIDDTLYTGRTYLSVPNKTFGNPDLTPEIADTWVAGVVLRPAFLRSFNLAVDYWNISIKDAIGNIGGNNAVQQCNLSNQVSPICAFVTRDPTTKAVIGTRTSPYNLTSLKTDGIDVEASYRVQLGNIFGGDPGVLNIRELASYVFENMTVSPLVPVSVNDAGNATASLPHLRTTTQLNYTKGGFGANVQVRYIGPMTWDKTRVLGVDTDFNHIGSNVYVDAQVSYKVDLWGHDQEIYLNIQNLLDKDPPYDPSVGGATPLPTDPNLFDQVGRMFRIGVRTRF